MKVLIVDKNYDEKKLNTFILDNFSNLSLNTLYKALRQKDIKVNNKRVNSNVTVYLNDEIQIFISDDLLFNKNSNLSFETIYEDDNILIVNKPDKIEVLGDNSLTSIIQKKYNLGNNFPYPCHRLDRNTKGLIIYAKNKLSLDYLFDKFKHHEIEKHYLAKVYGIPKFKNKTFESYLFKDSKKSQVYISDTYKKGYQKITTSFNLVSKNINENTSILDVTLHSGRTHQIRAHLAYIGYPIIGDGKYGVNYINKKFNAKTQELYAYKLIFNFVNNSGALNYLNGKEFALKINII